MELNQTFKETEEKPNITIAQARKKLGKASKKYTDAEVKKIINILFGFAFITYEIYQKESQDKSKKKNSKK